MLSGVWNGASIAVAASPDGPCVGLDASPVASSAGSQERTWWQRATSGLHQAAPGAHRLTVVVPEDWMTTGAAGAARLEIARAALVEQPGLPSPVVVGRPHAAVAYWLDRRQSDDRPGRATALVVDLSPGLVRTARCDVDGLVVGLGPLCGEPAAGGSRGVGAALLAALPASGAGAVEDLADLYANLRRGLGRLNVSLAVGEPAFREVPVAGLSGMPPERWLTARRIRELSDARDAALRLAVRVVGATDATTVLVTGPEAGDPLAEQVLRDAVGAAPSLVVLPPSAVAEGAACIAAGRVTTRHGPPARFSLPVHRLVAGRTVEESLPLPASGDDVCAAGDDRRPLVFTVAERGAGGVCVEVDGARRTLAEAGPVPPGRYRVGLWPGPGAAATLVLRPADGGAAILRGFGGA